MESKGSGNERIHVIKNILFVALLTALALVTFSSGPAQAQGQVEFQDLELTINDVILLANDSELPQPQGHQLTAPLERAQFDMEAERIQSALNQLNHYVVKRERFIKRGVLDVSVTPCFYILDLILDGWLPQPC